MACGATKGNGSGSGSGGSGGGGPTSPKPSSGSGSCGESVAAGSGGVGVAAHGTVAGELGVVSSSGGGGTKLGGGSKICRGGGSSGFFASSRRFASGSLNPVARMAKPGPGATPKMAVARMAPCDRAGGESSYGCATTPGNFGGESGCAAKLSSAKLGWSKDGGGGSAKLAWRLCAPMAGCTVKLGGARLDCAELASPKPGGSMHDGSQSGGPDSTSVRGGGRRHCSTEPLAILALLATPALFGSGLFFGAAG